MKEVNEMKSLVKDVNEIKLLLTNHTDVMHENARPTEPQKPGEDTNGFICKLKQFEHH